METRRRASFSPSPVLPYVESPRVPSDRVILVPPTQTAVIKNVGTEEPYGRSGLERAGIEYAHALRAEERARVDLKKLEEALARQRAIFTQCEERTKKTLGDLLAHVDVKEQ